MNVHALEVRFNVEGNENVLCPVILECDHSVVLVDCGYPGFANLLETAAGVHGITLQQLTGVIITHHDIDHYGCLYELKELHPKLKVYCSAEDEPYIGGTAKSLRLQQAEDTYASLPDDQKAGAFHFQEMLRNVKAVPVDGTFKDGDEISFCSGVRIVSTPGHMPGHISLYIRENNTLIAGDAVVFENGKLGIANPDYTLDLKTAVASIRKLQRLQIDKIICYHGGVVTGDINKQFEKLVAAYAQLR